MRIINAGYEILSDIKSPDIYKRIEAAGRTCYKSEDKIGVGTCYGFVKMIVDKGHEAMLEHGGLISVKFIVDRGVSHELVRHRIASFAQESTRYCNYSADKFDNEITFIKPCFWDRDITQYGYWKYAMTVAEIQYFKLIENGATPQEARSVLPNSLKTEIVMSMNPREWRHFFKLRTAKAAHPQMREITIPLLEDFIREMPEMFEDIIPEV